MQMNPEKKAPAALLEDQPAFEQSLTAILEDEPAQSFALLLIGMDRFKEINEMLDTAVRSQILKLVGQRLQSALRAQDRAFHLPGEEFAVLLQPVPLAEDVRILADRLTDLLQKAYLVRGQIIDVSASIGIVLGPNSATDYQTVLKRAGIALRDAKLSGSGAARVFEAAMEDRLVARHALTLDLRKALLLRQLEVHYQPQLEITSQKLSGFEALIRWRHPELGLVSPGEFIPLAEEIGLIGMIGDWVLRTACLEAAHLPADVVVAVNASPLQFKNASFVASIERALSDAALPPERLEIEITEGVLIQNGTAIISMLNDIRSLGVRLAMDDFGTGYSSLGQLAKLPFNTIKIDRSLVGGSAKQRAIVRAIATLGDGLGMSTLAEGIETEEELASVRSDGCLSVQGYLFGKAGPAHELDAVLARLFHQSSSTPALQGTSS